MNPTSASTDRAAILLLGRREVIGGALGRPLRAPGTGPQRALSEEAWSHLLDEARNLYWNEMEWERITGDASASDGPVARGTFAGFMTFVRGLLLTETRPDARSSAEPRPEVVEEVLRFLAARVVELDEALGTDDPEEPERLRGELRLTDQLLDLVLYEYHGLADDEIERLEAIRS